MLTEQRVRQHLEMLAKDRFDISLALLDRTGIDVEEIVPIVIPLFLGHVRDRIVRLSGAAIIQQVVPKVFIFIPGGQPPRTEDIRSFSCGQKK